jgi:hypothetical protein
MRRRKILWSRWLMGLVAVSFLVSGCAAGTATGPVQASTPSIELLLVKAGFETVPNEHPLCEGVCQRLTPGQIVPYKKGSKTVYGYLSPETKRMYVGTEAEYQTFINLAVMQKIDERQRPVANENNDPQFWTMWADMYGGH